MTLVEPDLSVEEALSRRIAKLERINAALMVHVERLTNQPEGAYSLFQTAIMLDGRVRSRTEELTRLMGRLERSHEALETAKNEAERANRSKTRFLASASHDLLQPLNATRLSVATLGDLPLDPMASAILRRVERGLETIEEVIKTLLDISKLDAGVVLPHVGAVSVRELFNELEADYGAITEGKGIRLVMRCPDELAVHSDANLLKRIVGNLVSNAVRYTDEGGVLLAARQRGERCRIDVVDTGRGIPEGERELIFDEFFRGRDAGEAGNGLGLGLSIVNRLVSTLGHELAFTSRVGRGSWFRLAVPACQPPVRPPECDASHQPRSLESRLVLVVENDIPTLKAVTELLEVWEMAVIAHSDVRDIPGRIAELTAADVILADFHLGSGITGVDIVSTVRAAAGRTIPAVVATADHTVEVQALIEAADCMLMHKPVKPAQLRSMLSFLLD